jgi:hypothetical protein
LNGIDALANYFKSSNWYFDILKCILKQMHPRAEIDII